jgi:hypothetical protein
LAAHEALSGIHRNGAHSVLTQVLRHFKHQPGTQKDSVSDEFLMYRIPHSAQKHKKRQVSALE